MSYANSNAASLPTVDADVKSNPSVYPTPEMMTRIVPICPRVPNSPRS